MSERPVSERLVSERLVSERPVSERLVSERLVRVYVNGRGVDVAAGGSALDAVRASSPADAALVLAGERAITDSRGIAAPHDAPVHGGAIFRVVSGRALRGDDAGSID